MKKCKRCGEEKLLECFYADKRKTDGHKNVCKECVLKNGAIYRNKNREKIRKRDRQNGYIENLSKERKIKRAKYKKEWLVKNKKKHSGYYHYHDGGKKGKAKRAIVKLRKNEQPQKCSICNIEIESIKLHGHHPNYNKPFEVVWCCPRCHGRIHRIDNKQAVPSKIAL